MGNLTKDDNRLVIDQQIIKCVEIYPNTGQLRGVPKNPRFIKDFRFEKLCKSIQDDPEYLNARPLIVIPYAAAYVVICGNMRLRACVESGFIEVPCVVLNPNTPPEKIRRYLLKDNISYGSDDYDIVGNEYTIEELEDWGFEMPFDMGDVETEKEPGTTTPKDPKLEIIFNGSLEAFDEIKKRVFEITKDYNGVELKG